MAVFNDSLGTFFGSDARSLCNRGLWSRVGNSSYLGADQQVQDAVVLLLLFLCWSRSTCYTSWPDIEIKNVALVLVGVLVGVPLGWACAWVTYNPVWEYCSF